jgi:heme-binding HmuY-like protein
LIGSRGPILGATLVSAVAIVLVALTLRQPDVPSYPLTVARPHDTGRALVGPVLYTLDATSAEAWRSFSFRLGAAVDGSGDLAFKRYAIVAGPGAGILDLGETAFDQVRAVPADGYLANEGAAEPRNPAIASWYTYGFFTHVLSPRPRVWAVRTADGHYAKLEMVGYYCPGPQPGCPTFRYVYQGDGTTRMVP